ncbi:hypothetical protein ACFQVD_11380 [Streptosporangium amethystogenes subsp. fukuiense]|uniref:Secreted protein n=1 Tax=Streptosporangium amethystogenes subsp. fukuiense TaxID=698418 RepID=A0ABW2SWM5_9ACTN
MRKGLIGVMLTALLAGGPAVAAEATTEKATAGAVSGDLLHWGPVRSAGGHGGYARANVWITDFGAETFTVSGTLHDRDGHPGHCAYIRARFHYTGGGTGWARPRSTCRANDLFRLSSDGEITRVDVRVCVLDSRKRRTSHCHVDVIRAETVANWPR